MSRLDAQTDDIGALAGTSTLDDLQLVAPLILDLQLRDKALARFDAPTRLRAEEVLQSAAQLMSMTEWDGKRLLAALGCTIKTVGDLDAGYERLGRCQRFLSLVARMAGLVDVVFDRREVVIGCAGLLKDTGQGPARLEELFRQGGFSAVDYLRLGEVSAALEQVQALAAPGSAQQARLPEHDPFATAPTVHLSTTRIDSYVVGERELLGDEVSNRIKLHLPECDACRNAVEYRRALLASSRPDTAAPTD